MPVPDLFNRNRPIYLIGPGVRSNECIRHLFGTYSSCGTLAPFAISLTTFLRRNFP